ncbi:MAG: hypothetical protein RL693_1183 [Verrucomicrobiota bacterium]|jgi:hypothetical protein
MKTPFLPLTRVLGTAAVATACLLSFSTTTQAKDKHKGNDYNRNDSHHDDRDHQSYSSHPRSSFTLSLGNGYAGRGYYYGPPNSSYYYQRPEVRYYATREAAPREYYGNDGYRSNSTDAAVQRALARRGYYNGSIDGAIGPQSRRAIARYQQDHGLRVTGDISSSLIDSLGI